MNEHRQAGYMAAIKATDWIDDDTARGLATDYAMGQVQFPDEEDYATDEAYDVACDKASEVMSDTADQWYAGYIAGRVSAIKIIA